ncbi:hypothetical protein B5P45_23395 [Phyllobacterium zundukense]|uniref:Propionyl-coenzyme A carboxylase alpha polypeptide n=1 Tax=Phyllobacterium zundukense TaxID=1867719 RepID=A0A2N9VR84_9HYPH|nr:hypothetical protein B5P45_23395 [Phyllobacterium zundukense]
MRDLCASVHPPLSCRTSPPQGGRSVFIHGDANIERRNLIRAGHPGLISPLVGEMPGRPEGGR